MSFLKKMLGQNKQEPRKLAVRKHYLPDGLYDLYVFYSDSPEPIAAVKGKDIIPSEQIEQDDLPKVMDLLFSHCFIMMGIQHRLKGDYQEAEKAYHMAIERSQKVSATNMVLEDALLNLAGLYLRMHRAPESESLYRQCLDIVSREVPHDLEEHAIVMDNLSQALLMQEKNDEAEKCNKQSLSIYKNMNPQQPADIAKCLGNLGLIQTKQEKFKEAENNLLEAIGIVESFGNQQYAAILYDNLANVYYRQSQFDRALQVYQKALGLLEQAYGPDHPETGICLARTGHTYIGMRDWGNAATYLKRASNIFANAQGPDSDMAQRFEQEFRQCLAQMSPGKS